MTSQPPDDPTPPAQGAPAESTAPIAPSPTPSPSPSPAPAPPPAAAAPAAAPPVIFQAIPRPPRVPWVNPDRRSHVIGSSVIAGLVLLGAGFGIGYASSSDSHDRSGPVRLQRGGGFPPGLRDGRMMPFPGHQLPGNRKRGTNPLPGATAIPSTPAPSSTK